MDNKAIDERRVEWVVLTKAPVPGLVKTRLIPELGEQGACDVYEQLLARLQETLQKVVANHMPKIPTSQVALWIAGDAEHKAFKGWQKLGDRVAYYKQPSGTDEGAVDLGTRMALAVQSALSRNHIPVLIGVDVPDLDEDYLVHCLQKIHQHELVISPAEDGGYGLLGMTNFYPELFVDKVWGTDTVFASTKRDIEKLNIDAAYLPEVWDVDEVADVERWELQKKFTTESAEKK
jgi:rSAM/selenodomain-associated transferase 1